MAESTFEKIRDILADKLEKDPATITPETLLKEDLEADSLDSLVVIVELEDQFGIQLDTDGAPPIQTVNDIVVLVDQAISA